MTADHTQDINFSLLRNRKSAANRRTARGVTFFPSFDAPDLLCRDEIVHIFQNVFDLRYVARNLNAVYLVSVFIFIFLFLVETCLRARIRRRQKETFAIQMHRILGRTQEKHPLKDGVYDNEYSQ